MRLLKVYLHGYKRFADRTSFTVDAPVVALVGPNEAGKSSVLEALALLGTNEAVDPGKLTRGQSTGESQAVVSAVFLLEDADREVIADIPEAKALRMVTVYKYPGGVRRLGGHPAPVRDTSLRDRIAVNLRKAAASPSLRDRRWDDDTSVAESLTELAARLEQADETLTAEETAVVEETGVLLGNVLTPDDPGYVRELDTRLRELLAVEGRSRPAQLVADALFPRLPRFEWFSGQARALRSSYALEELSAAVPTALGNLARLSGLDIAQLADAASSGRRGEVQELQERANARLEVAYADAWSQGRLSVSFNVEEATLHVFVREEAGTYWDITERSDGLRWFVALVALLAERDVATPPILLIDEAEQHLHYDAQADLIRQFQDQTTAAGVIYTTHSAGCLPQDIGSGVKVVRRDDNEHSTIKNGFWVDGPGSTASETGFSSVLMEMGASTLAFSSARHAVFCEGRTELVLLPSVLREACGWRVLPFQVAPGLASINRYLVPHLDLAAARVAFLVDGDKPGAGIAKKLRHAGVPPERICRLSPGAKPLTIEDFIDARVHRDALHAEMRTSGVEVDIPLSAFAAAGRAARLDKWFEERNIAQPHKVAVAHHIVSQARAGTQICDGRRRSSIAQIGDGLLGVLGLAMDEQLRRLPA